MDINHLSVSNCMKSIYPFVSIAAIQAGDYLHTANEVINILIFGLQILIAVLTIIKIIKDIKHHKYKSVDDEIKKEEKRHPIIAAIFKYLNTIFKK
jgi:hypothetical protein